MTKINDTAIRELKSEAEMHGDDMQALICLIALEGAIEHSFEDSFGGGGWSLPGGERDRLESMSQAEARTECERVIREARELC